MAGVNEPYSYVPYFWSDLFDLGFEAVGDLDSRLRTCAVRKGPFREGIVFYPDGGKVKGVFLWNAWDRVHGARDLITKKRTYTQPEELKGKL